MDKVNEAFLSLVRLGIGHEAGGSLGQVDWKAVSNLAAQHALSAIVLDGAQVLEERGELSGMNEEVRSALIATTLLSYEQNYRRYRAGIGKLARFYNAHGFKLMVLKGYGLSLNYPIPEHRPCGDIDIWLFGKYKEADAALTRELGIRVDNSHDHHTVFRWMGYSVENHYDWVNVHTHRSNKSIEKIFKDLAMDDSNRIDIDGNALCLPSPNLHALFLLRHALVHFAAGGINLRQLLDWGFFAEKNMDRVDWKWLEATAKEYHMYDFYLCLNSLCVRDLGFTSLSSLPQTPDLALKERVLQDILSPEFGRDMPKRLFPRIVYKIRRWNAAKWKNRLCYEENLFSSFVHSAFGHLVKPKSI